MDDQENLNSRIRRRAYLLWEAEGRPAGREEAHWDMAAELVAIEDNQKRSTVPIVSPAITGPSGEPVEPPAAVENLGEFPTAMTDQGEQVYPPKRAAASVRRPAAKAASPKVKPKPKPKATSKPASKTNGTARRKSKSPVRSPKR